MIQKLKCFIGFHIKKIRQTPLRDKYANPSLYCICCYKEFKIKDE